MALYTILFGVSIFLIILLLTVIRKMFFDWKEEHKIERMMQIKSNGRPAVSLIIYNEKCVVRHRQYAEDINIFDVITKSDTSLKRDDDSKDEDKRNHDYDSSQKEIISTQVGKELQNKNEMKPFNLD